ncbi:hypothetical protein [Cyanobium sp. Morenito 9A2]|uniref:hypothetical protein n=1 Tax=Cyanobium sp. Morenito 9A2 TaxID=2823718 RepID=UPI0020CCCFDB|nr:hypothetical protein [Cyanobium sp. Morenito 9A2]MCP9850388.1 hypothetical protein [Cyanobium sp. Morenito 9A2]
MLAGLVGLRPSELVRRFADGEHRRTGALEVEITELCIEIRARAVAGEEVEQLFPAWTTIKPMPDPMPVASEM